MSHSAQLALLLLWIVCAWWAAIESIRAWQFIRVKTAIFYLIYIALAPTVCAIPWILGVDAETYKQMYWTVDLLQDWFLAVVGIQMVSHLIPRRLAYVWGGGLLVLLLYAFIHDIIIRTGPIDVALLNMTIMGDFVVMMILVLMAVVPGAGWTTPRALSVAAIVLICLGNVLPNIEWLRGSDGGLIASAAQQVGALPGVLLMGWAGRVARRRD